MRVSNFIVSNGKVNGSHPVIRMSGEIYIPLGTPVPVIVRGSGCIGIGIVERLDITSSQTEVYFELDDTISKREADAYYNLYRNAESSAYSSGGDPYKNTDAVIPGAMTSLSGRNTERVNSHDSRRRNGKSKSLSDYLDDDFDF